MRIAVDGRGFGNRPVGLERAAWQTYRALCAEQGPHHYRGYTRGPGASPGPAMDLCCLGGRGRLGAADWLLRRLPRALRRDPPHRLHYPLFPGPVPAGIRTVATVHDVVALRHPEWSPRGPGALYRWAFRRWLPGAWRAVADSEYTALEAAALTELDPARIRVVPLGVDERFGPQAADDLERVLAGSGLAARGLTRPYLLAVGTVSPRKDLPTAVRTVGLLRARGVDVQLLVAGARGWGAEDLDRAVLALDDPGAVVGPVAVDDDHLPALYAGALAVLVPSLYEGFGLPVLEGMASGAPVLASDRTSLPEVAGGAALLLPPGEPPAWADAVEGLLAHPDHRRDVIRAGLRRAAEFPWSRTAAALRAVFEEQEE